MVVVVFVVLVVAAVAFLVGPLVISRSSDPHRS